MGANKMKKRINIFYNDKMLDEYEKSERWDKSILYLTEKLKDTNVKKDVLLRLSVQSWYILTFWDCCMPIEKLQRSMFEISLKNSYKIFRKFLYNDSDCLWVFGYLMSVNQLDFSFIENDILTIESLGISLIYEAYNCDPNNKLAEILFLENKGEKKQCRKKKEKLELHIRECFPSNSEVDKYFLETFTNDY